MPRPRILVVDDDTELRETLAEYLESEGFQTVPAANGLEALLHLKRQRPAAVVLDLAMPRLGGLEALKRIRAFDPAILVVVTTGNPDREIHRRARELGARAVLTKPFALIAVADILRGETPAVSESPAVSRESTSPPAAGRALVVDDDPDMRDLLATFCIEQGFETRTAGDAGSGLRALVDILTDVVLLDIQMPGMNGVDAVPAMLAMAPDVKIIMVSGSGDADLARRALALGAFDFVTKPLDVAYLRQSLDTALAMKRLES